MRKDKDEKPVKGQVWVNLVTGLEYRWDGKVWVSTGKYPYGRDPMALMGGGGAWPLT